MPKKNSKISIRKTRKIAEAKVAAKKNSDSKLKIKIDPEISARAKLYGYWLVLGAVVTAGLIVVSSFFWDSTHKSGVIVPEIVDNAVVVNKSVIVPEIAPDQVVVANAVSLSSEQQAALADEYFINGKAKQDSSINPDLRGALVDYSTAIALNSNYAQAYANRGQILSEMGDYANALINFNTAIQLDPTDALSFYGRAVAKTKLDDWSGAIVDYSAAIESDAASRFVYSFMEQPNLYSKRAQLRLWTKDNIGAIQDYTMAIELGMEQNRYYDFAGRAEAKMAMADFAGSILDYTYAIQGVADAINNAATSEDQDVLSRTAMGYYETRGALRLKRNDILGAQEDVSTAIRISIELGDHERAISLKKVLDAMDNIQ